MEYNKAIDQFISYCFEPYEERTSEEYPGSVFWYKSGEIIVEIRNSEYFFLNYTIWKRISEMFNLNYDDTQSVIRVWVEQHYNLGGLTLQQWRRPQYDQLEQQYNLRGLTPYVFVI